MLPDFISITTLQRQLKSVFESSKPVRLVLSNNSITGLVFSREAAEALLRSGVLDQIREELWELGDKETVQVVRDSRKGRRKHSAPFKP